jgi:phosphatidylinositol alpha 1,6-mannosyltransferase
MRIAFFTESLLPLVDGVSHTLSHLFSTLECEGVDFRIYAPFVPGPDISWSNRVRPVRYTTFPLHRAYRLSLPGGRRIAADLDEFAPDIIHVVSPTPMAIWAQRQARLRGVPVVATFHTHFISYFPYYGAAGLEPVGWRILRWFHNRCTVTYAPTATIVHELAAHGVLNVRLWSRGVDTVRFTPEARDAGLRARLGADEQTPVLLLVSRLVREKDLADLPRVDAELRRRGTRYSLAIVGDGPMRRDLESSMPHAHFAGHLRGDELARWYASADVFIFPSTTETFANVVQEAQASGLPAVVADRGGPQSVIEPGVTGYVARSNDPRHMADLVERLLVSADERRAMGAAGRRRALGRSWDAVNAELVGDYRELIGQPRFAREPLRRLA